MMRNISTVIWILVAGTALLGSGPAQAEPQAAARAKGDQGAAESDAAPNLLRNSSFEDGKDMPAEWQTGAELEGVAYSWDKSEAHQGKASLCLHKTANRFFPVAQWYQIVDRKTDSPLLQVSAQVKARKASKAVIDVAFLDENDEMISHEWAAYIGAKAPKDPPADHDWREYTGKIKIPERARKVQIGFQIYGPGKVWFDEARAESVKE